MSRPSKSRGAQPPAPLAPIRSAAAHRAALSELERLWESKPGTPELDRFEVLAMLIERYERERFPIAAPTPAEALRFRMEQLGISPGEVAELLGGRSRLSELLSGKREPSMTQARQLHALGVPADLLLSLGQKRVKGYAVKKARLEQVAEVVQRASRRVPEGSAHVAARRSAARSPGPRGSAPPPPSRRA